MKKYQFTLNRPVSGRFGSFFTEAVSAAETPEEAWGKVRKDVLPKNQKLRKLAEKRHPLNATKMKVLLDFDLVVVGKTRINFVDADGVSMYDYTIIAVEGDEIIALSDGIDGDKAIVPMERVFALY